MPTFCEPWPGKRKAVLPIVATLSHGPQPEPPGTQAPGEDHVKRVTSLRGASAPGREPRRTKSTGAGAALAISERVGPEALLLASDRTGR